MLNWCTAYRKIIASLLAGWMAVIIISGIVFIHKEITSDGTIVTHIHPYDFTNKTKKHHHKSDAEIQFLNVLFHGSFLETPSFIYETPLFQEYPFIYSTPYESSYKSLTPQHYYLRGPPILI